MQIKDDSCRENWAAGAGTNQQMDWFTDSIMMRGGLTTDYKCFYYESAEFNVQTFQIIS
jgi:hypothetical protein